MRRGPSDLMTNDVESRDSGLFQNYRYNNNANVGTRAVKTQMAILRERSLSVGTLPMNLHSHILKTLHYEKVLRRGSGEV